MKTFVLLSLFISTLSFAQTETIVPKENVQPKNEFGFNFFSLTNIHKEYDPIDRYQYKADFNYFSGVYYKYHFGKNAVRSSFDFNQKAILINIQPSKPYYYSESAKQEFVTLKAGYEREFGTKKLKTYLFSDLIFNYNHVQGIRSSPGCFGWGEDSPFNEERFEYGIAGGGGLRYSVSKNIVLSYEFSAQQYCYVYQDILNSGKKWVGFGHHLNPVSKLGLAFTF
jgi:hypothetical protein